LVADAQTPLPAEGAPSPKPGAPAPASAVASAPAGDSGFASLDDARLDVRVAGYCVYCDHIIERNPDGTCPKGHPSDAVTGDIVLIDDDPLPTLPAFNWAAFLIPFIWGPAHDQWIGAVFLPIWLFADSIVATASKGGALGIAGAVVVFALTLLFEWWFAKRANGLAFRRVIGKQSAETFARRQRVWAIAAVPAVIALIGWGVWFHVGVAPTLPTQ
jgi:hypothetical protein